MKQEWGRPVNKRLAPFFILCLVLSGCASRPLEELVLADVALRAAQKVKADALSPDAYRKAENFYLRAKKDYAEGYFDSCKKFSADARLMAEQAEYRALLKQSQVKGQIVEDPTSVPAFGGGLPPGGP
jgi:hypothetical protein